MLFKQIEQNKRKTAVLMVLFSLLVLALGWAVGYVLNGDHFSGIGIAGAILAVYLPLTFMTATSQVLQMAGAREIAREDHPMLFNIVENLCIPARIPMPKIYVIDDPAPNAFATGIKPENGAVAFTTGLLEQLNRDELEGVAAHEIAHIRNYDIRLMTICIALVGVVALIGDFASRTLYYRGSSRRGRDEKSHPAIAIIAILFIVLAPLAARFVHLAVSRNREYYADATAVELTRNPNGLKNALIKISESPLDVKRAKDATAALYISNPYRRQRRRRARSWMATHPPTAERIARIEAM
ncbi:zinc metalloprotease HtpX [Numidum massiliense]|uniref:zinc metalloprotease HtpX n=1 Tax=Numidum massiliense TaxID=1522315 RepID=UPI0006D55729|nr:zinc metalloprotease HtpX [Numidum massiliense]